jgi:hypothetical protein
MVPGGGVEPPRAEARRILSRRGTSSKSFNSERFQSLHKNRCAEMCGSARSREDLSLIVCAQSGSPSKVDSGKKCEWFPKIIGEMRIEPIRGRIEKHLELAGWLGKL